MGSSQRRLFCFVLLTAILGCAAGAPASAQDSAKPAAQKWRPKDGSYGLDPGTDPNVSCERLTLHDVELSKRLIVSDEMYKCEIIRMTGAGPATLRLDAKCDHVKSGKSRDTIVLRKIDDQSFFMGWRGERAYRYVYCPEISPTEATRREVLKQVERAAWQPRDGVYASPGAEFDDRCMKSGDAVIGLADLFVSIGASRCEASRLEGSTETSIRLDMRCDVKGVRTGLVPISKGSQIVFVPVGAEKIIITNSGNQTVTLQKSEYGEFSAPAKLLAYCPDAAQRAYADSRKAK